MHNKLDLTGQRFGKLVAIEEAGKNKSGRVLWRCRCDCGNERVVQTKLLRAGSAKSCGCSNGARMRNDVAGQRFGRLLVLEDEYIVKGNRHRHYCMCKCDCGNIKEVNYE